MVTRVISVTAATARGLCSGCGIGAGMAIGRRHLSRGLTEVRHAASGSDTTAGRRSSQRLTAHERRPLVLLDTCVRRADSSAADSNALM
jgi:hypothetical protein